MRARGMRARILRVHIERRMSDVQRARHVKLESLAEVRREKRNRDIVGDGADGMRKKDEGERKGCRWIEEPQGVTGRVYPTALRTLA